MKEINIARILTAKRKEKGITQDELAGYIGVSKASVSKWETAQSYPDITFLPQLAAFFNISIDDLLGYEPQMTKEDITKLYHRLAEEFASAPFDEVLAAIDETVRKYYSCFPLLYQLGVLLVNHHMLADSADHSQEILTGAKKLFERVKKESDDVELAKQALHMEALCLLALHQPQDMLALLDGSDAGFSSTEILFASAYQMLGRMEEAASALQGGIYKQILSAVDLLCQYLTLSMEDMPRFDSICQRATTIIDTFGLRSLHPGITLKFFLSAACGYAAGGRKEQALEALREYVDLATGSIYPLILHGDDFFDRLEGWLSAIDTFPPRNEATIKKGFVDAVDMPAFSVLADDERYIQLIGRLKRGI